MSKAMQITLFVNKSQINFQDSNYHKRYISFPPQYIKSLFYDYSRKYYQREKSSPQTMTQHRVDLATILMYTVESACQCRRLRRCWFDPWVGKIPWRRKWQLNPVFLPGKSHRQRGLADNSPWGHKESDTTKHTHAHNVITCEFLQLFQLCSESFNFSA